MLNQIHPDRTDEQRDDIHFFFVFQEKTHGIAFQLLGEAALQYLQTRECTLGGYVTVLHTFYPKDKSKPSFPVLLYMATPSNRHWMGPAPLSQIAEQVQ